MGSCCTNSSNDSCKISGARNFSVWVKSVSTQTVSEPKGFRASIMLFAIWVMAALTPAQNPDRRVRANVLSIFCMTAGCWDLKFSETWTLGWLPPKCWTNLWMLTKGSALTIWKMHGVSQPSWLKLVLSRERNKNSATAERLSVTKGGCFYMESQGPQLPLMYVCDGGERLYLEVLHIMFSFS